MAGESWLWILGQEQGKWQDKGLGQGCCRRRCQETTYQCISPSPAVLSRRIPELPQGPCGRSTQGPQGSRSQSRNLPDRVTGGRLGIRLPCPSERAGTKIATRIGPYPLLRLLHPPRPAPNPVETSLLLAASSSSSSSPRILIKVSGMSNP